MSRPWLSRLLLDSVADERDPFSREDARRAASVFGMWLLIMTLAMLFGATILAYLVIRIDVARRGAHFVPFGAPPIPPLLIVNTLVLTMCGVFLHRAVSAARAGSCFDRCTRPLQAAFWLGCVFLILQAIAWWQMARASVPDATGLTMIFRAVSGNLYGWTFFVLTGVHALHVIGGLIPLCIVMRRAPTGWYSTGGERGLVMLAMYWHFLYAAWLVLYATLWIGSQFE